MTKNYRVPKRSRILGLSEEELAKVKSLKSTDCPRCYCWWWRSPKFEFEISPLEGCKADELLFQKNPKEPSVCSRATNNPLDRDLHEPYEPHLINDGFSPLYFFKVKAGKTFVYLEASDFEGDPIEITQVIGIEPTKNWKKGIPAAPNSIYTCRQSGWRLYSSLPLSEPLEEHLDNLLAKLETRTEAIKNAVHKFSLGIQVVDQAHHMQKIRLFNEMLSRIYNRGLFVEFAHHHIPYELDEKNEVN
ncbi:MAG: DUF4279 domain-containing protein [Candidatus Hodarchaeota archaeon]